MSPKTHLPQNREWVDAARHLLVSVQAKNEELCSWEKDLQSQLRDVMEKQKRAEVRESEAAATLAELAAREKELNVSSALTTFAVVCLFAFIYLCQRARIRSSTTSGEGKNVSHGIYR